MANYRSRSSRERRLRARYRKKVWTCGIIMLIIGLVLGYVLCMMFLGDTPSFLTSASATPTPRPVITVITEVPTAEPTPEPTAVPTVEPTVEPTAVPMDTPEPTAEPNIEPAIVFNSLNDATEAPTAEPTAVPTVEPTAEPTPEPTPEPTVEPTVEPTAEPTPEPTAEPTPEPTPEPTVEPTVEPTAEPTPEPTAEPTPEPTPAPVIVPFGESCTFDTQITATGSARLIADDAPYETLNLTLRVDAYKNPAYFEAQYAETYNLQGNEAAIQFDLTLNGYTGATEIIPQNFLLITCCGEDASVTAQSFQLMDTEIAGKTNIAIASDVTSTLYKRYDYNADQGDMVYMVVTTYNDGKEATYWFEIQGPEEEPAAETETGEAVETAATSDSGIDPNIWLTIGSRGDEVKKLQAKLIELGLLTGSPDGQYGKYTASAVQIMQKRFGMEQTGSANASFLEKLYADGE